MTPTPFPEEILGTARQLVIKVVIALLALGICACCAYGMSKIDPQLVNEGMSVINNLKVPIFTMAGLCLTISITFMP